MVQDGIYGLVPFCTSCCDHWIGTKVLLLSLQEEAILVYLKMANLCVEFLHRREETPAIILMTMQDRNYGP